MQPFTPLSHPTHSHIFLLCVLCLYGCPYVCVCIYFLLVCSQECPPPKRGNLFGSSYKVWRGNFNFPRSVIHPKEYSGKLKLCFVNLFAFFTKGNFAFQPFWCCFKKISSLFFFAKDNICTLPLFCWHFFVKSSCFCTPLFVDDTFWRFWCPTPVDVFAL